MYLKRVWIIIPKVIIFPDSIQVFCIQATQIQLVPKITKNTH